MSRFTASAAEGLGCACALLVACASAPTGRAPGAESALRLWVSPVVRWEPGAPRDMRFAIENASNRTVALAEPDAAFARVDVFAGPDPDRVCGVEPAPGGAVPAPPRIELAPGERFDVRVDLERACRGIPAGEYRFVVSYRSPTVALEAASRGPRPWSGALPAGYGNILVERVSALARTPPVREGSRRGGASRRPCSEPESARSR